MTLLDVGERYRFAGTDLSTYAVAQRAIADANELPPLRGEDSAWTGLAGRRSMPKLLDSRRFPLGLWVLSRDADGALVEPTDARQARANLDALMTLFGRRYQQTLERIMPDGSTRSAQAEVVAVSNFEDPAGGEIYGMVVDFLLADPAFYGADVTEGADIAASPTDVVVTHPGSVAGHELVIDITGPADNPRITNQGSGWYVELLVSVAAGAHAIIDCSAFTATNDGINAIGSLRHSGGKPFMELVPGANTLRVTSDSTGGHVDFTFGPGYL